MTFVFFQLLIFPEFASTNCRISVNGKEKQATTKPTTWINIIYKASLSKQIGSVEVKTQYRALNHRLVGIDLIRITALVNSASDKHRLKVIFAFIAFAKYSTSYILHCVQTHLYTMCESAHIQPPLTFDQKPLFLSQVNKIIKAIACFQYIINSDNHNRVNGQTTLTDNILFHVTDPKLTRERKSITGHYNR
ncbi:hypothetical protein PHYBLDRAFT_167945 [Phycomyces blakesleeanus NRRL 1555(-)]|uniref:Uncharacterized protein n=1 Tax=Phycomyces blakesleeanus (strain ATCC 8743b / DSM 1359 / FGSC 10004 / NBRC 33097 / NRRL 1555) TaxID=763407 RepID=A0A162NIH4_PHYB8|nr:hypothetical protein PHYBLDRAFT_167945 [Phycomyces blakesleeanus NRRL 1555(-)]OAD74538.1 hypothetical protein PHYBLDRAFT_167945 [Phycomyces blakesleeanus NRRL 1555(-)]|eukprot:XP_018292578.1 hypothetical protein PHYBLDRAFT_167945 [Phycomyces blakesleeanus NRRL 1555(-)]